MKPFKYFIILILMVIPFTGYCQLSAAQKIAGNYEGKKGFTTVNISKSMFKMLSRIKTTDPEYKEIQKFATHLEGIKIVIQEDAKGNTFKNELSALSKSLLNSGYEELMSVNEEGNVISFKALEKNNRISELVMSIVGEDTVLIIISGNFLLEELTDITGNINLGGMDKVQKLKNRKK